MYDWLGHPLIDVGIAALTALSGRADPHALTESDLEQAAIQLGRWYTDVGAMRNFAKGSIFHNAGYGMPNPAIQHRHIQRTLFAWRATDSIADTCAFCGRPAAYRASRQDMPMLNGEALYNFGGGGRAGVPVCGWCSLAIQALPLGCIRSGGTLIACHSDDQALTLAIAADAVRRTRQALTLTGEIPVFAFERTRLVDLLIDWLARIERRGDVNTVNAPSLTGYIFTNAGASPAVRIYRLDSGVVSFLERAQHAPDASLTGAWNRAVERAWVRGKKKDAVDDRMRQCNRLYEMLLALPAESRTFLRRYLLPTQHWGVAALFLRKVMGMDQERITLLKTLGERFATYTRSQKRFFYPFARTQEYSKWRRHILNAADDMRRKGDVLITFDEFIAAFTAPPGEINDWRLARDLIVLAMFEQGIQPDEPLFDDESESESEMVIDATADDADAEMETNE